MIRRGAGDAPRVAGERKRYHWRVNATQLPILALALIACGPSQPTAPVVASDPGEPATATATSAVGGDTPPRQMKPILDAHNAHRTKHCAPPLQWSKELARTAQSWATTLARQGCNLKHSSSKFGENLAAATTVGPGGAADLWYAEIGKYEFGKGGFSMGTGHFTQVAWVGSQKLGCGTATCKDREIWVCNYDPPGNMEGQFQANVLPTTCKR